MTGILTSLIGANLSPINVSLSALSLSSSGKPTTWTSPTLFCTVSGNHTTPSYNWVLNSTSGNSWVISSGQGTSAAVAQCSGLNAGDVATADFYCVVTADSRNTTSPVCSLTYTNTL
jgi:hypothetical protein